MYDPTITIVKTIVAVSSNGNSGIPSPPLMEEDEVKVDVIIVDVGVSDVAKVVITGLEVD